MSEPAAQEELPPASPNGPAMAVMFALMAPWCSSTLLTIAARWAFHHAEAGGSHGLVYLVMVLLAVLLPCGQAFAVFRITRSKGARVVGSVIAMLCVPAYLAWMVMLTWTHD